MCEMILFGIFGSSSDEKIPLYPGDLCLMNYPNIGESPTIYRFHKIKSGIEISAKYKIENITAIGYEDEMMQNMAIFTKDHNYMIRKFLHIDFSDELRYDPNPCDILRCVLG